jgi:hypothetical protein
VPYTISIAGVDRTALIKRGSVSINKTYGEPWTCDFDTYDTDGGYFPVVGHPVEVAVDGDVYFGGIVRTVDRRKTSAELSLLMCSVSCTDWNHFPERRLTGRRQWANVTAGSIIIDLVNDYLTDDGFDTSLVEDGPTIAEFKTDYDTVAGAFGQLNELAEGYRLFIDQDQQVRFFYADASPAVELASFDIPVAAKNIQRLSVKQTDEDYANYVVGRISQALRDPQTETFEGASPTTTVTVAFPMAAPPTVTLDETPQTVGIYGVDTGRDWYWSEGGTELYQDSEAAPFTGTLSVTYIGTDSIYVLAKDDAEIADRAAKEGTSGRYEKLIEIDALLSRADAQAMVDAYLYAHIRVPLIATYTTDDYLEPDAKSLLPGTSQAIMIDGWGSQFDAYTVRTIRATDFVNSVGPYNLRYEVEAHFGSLTKTPFQWFKDLIGKGSGTAPIRSGNENVEYFYWFVGGCGPVDEGEDVAPHYPHAHNAGQIYLASCICRVPPTDEDLIFNIESTMDGVTWTSVSDSEQFIYEAGRVEPAFFTNISTGGAVLQGMWFRLHVLQSGLAEGVQIKLAAKPTVSNETGSLIFDGSDGTGINGDNTTSEWLLVL